MSEREDRERRIRGKQFVRSLEKTMLQSERFYQQYMDARHPPSDFVRKMRLKNAEARFAEADPLPTPENQTDE